MRLSTFFVFVILTALPFILPAQSQLLPSQAKGAARAQVAMLNVNGTVAAGIVAGFNADKIYIATVAHVTDLGSNPLPNVDVRFENSPDVPRQGSFNNKFDPPNQGDLIVVVVNLDDGLRAFLNGLDFAIFSPVPLPPVGSPVTSIGYSDGSMWTNGMNEALLPIDRGNLHFTSEAGQGQSGGAVYNEAWELIGIALRSGDGTVYARPMEEVIKSLKKWEIPVRLTARSLEKRAKGADELARENEIRAISASVQLATQELQNKDPEGALKTALAGVETTNLSRPDRIIIPGSIAVIAGSVADEDFGGVLREHSDAVLKVSYGPSAEWVVTIGADNKAIRWSEGGGHSLQPASSTVLAGDNFALARNTGMIASTSSSGQIMFWNSNAPDHSPNPYNFGEFVKLLAFSETGGKIAAIGIKGRTEVWDVTTGDLVWTAPAPISNASLVLLGDSCSCLLVGTEAGEVIVWYFQKNKPIVTPRVATKITFGSFAGKDQFLFCTDDGGVWLTTVHTGSPPIKIGQHKGRITGLALSPDGTIAATTAIDGVVFVWDLTQRLMVKRIRPNASSTLSEVSLSRISNAIAFSPDGRALALAYRNGTVALWDLGADADAEAYEAFVMRGHAGAVTDLCFSPDGNWLASASLDRTARLWRLQTASRPRLEQSDSGPAIHEISRDGSYLISGGQADGRVQLWSGSSLKLLRSIRVNAQPNGLAINRSGTRAFIGTVQGELLMWETNNSSARVIPGAATGAISAIALSPDKSLLAAIGVNGNNLKLCHIGNYEPDCSVIPELVGWGHPVTFSEDGRWLAAGSDVDENTGLGIVFDLDRKTTTFLRGHSAGIVSIQVDGKMKRAVTASWDGTVRVWDISSGKELLRLVEPKGHTVTAGFTPDGHWIATGSFVGKSVRLWRMPDQLDGNVTVVEESNSARLVLDSQDFNSIGFDPGGNILAVATSDGNLRLFHVSDGKLGDGKLRAVLKGAGSPIQSFHFRPDGLEVSASTTGGQILTWRISPLLDLDDNLLLNAARSVLPIPGSLASRVQEALTNPATRSDGCEYSSERNVGLPPHNLSGSARAREHITVQDSCNSSPSSLVGALIAEREGDTNEATKNFIAARNGGDFSAEIGLGDLDFVDSAGAPDEARAFEHYSLALQHGAAHAARPRIGWLLLSDPKEEAREQAQKYFKDAITVGDPDGFAGLAWMEERFGTSSADIEASFSNYLRAQYIYELADNSDFAKEVAERRATLAYAIAPERVADLFLSTRSSFLPINTR